MGALFHFNMMTYGGCSPDTAAFDPAALDTDQWAASFKAMGVYPPHCKLQRGLVPLDGRAQ